jgi:putative hydrolase of the HAD superfamily
MSDPRRRLVAVTFDCWNTLIREREFITARAQRVAALRDALVHHGRALDADALDAALERAHRRHIELWCAGIGSGSAEMASWALADAGIEDPTAAAALGRHFEDAGLAGDIEALPGAGETLARLADAGVRIALVCDTGFSPGRVVRRMLEREGLLEFLEVQVFSDEVGVPKPHARMFEAALGPFGAEPGASVHVGDLRRTDVAGGRSFGMGTLRIRAAFDDRSDDPDADAVADSHEELLALRLERVR